MNRILKSLIFGLLLNFTFLGIAQTCSDYYPMSKGTSYVLTKYDKKNKIESVSSYEIVDFTKNGATEVAIVRTIITNDKGEETVNAEYEITCSGDEVTMDLNSILKEKMAQSSANTSADVEISGHNPVIPNGLTEGQTLPESDMEMDVSAGSMKMKFGVKSFDKKVIGREEVTVPAGTFDCIVISQQSETKLLITKHNEVKVWLAEGVGVVKEETYDKKGNLIGHEVLTSFSK